MVKNDNNIMKAFNMLKLTLLIMFLGTLSYSCGNVDANNVSNNKVINTNQNNENTNQNNNEMKTIQLTKEDFLTKVADYENSPQEWKYLGDKPAIIDFYADWCGPCKMVAPILEELAAEYAESIYVYKIDTEKEQELAGAFGIRSIPSILFIPMEGSPQMAQGALPKNSLKEAIDNVLLKK